MFSSVGRFFRITAFTLFCLVFIAFAVDNRESVDLNLFPIPYHIELPLFVIAIVFFFLGSVMGYLITVISQYHLKHRLKQSEKTNNALRNQLDGLRVEHQIGSSLTHHTTTTTHY